MSTKERLIESLEDALQVTQKRIFELRLVNDDDTEASLYAQTQMLRAKADSLIELLDTEAEVA